MSYNLGNSLRAIIKRYLPTYEELSSEELQECLQIIARSFLPLKNILQTVAENFLPLRSDLSKEELQDRLTHIADAFLPLFGNMARVRILVEEEELLVPIKGELRAANACYYPVNEEAENDEKEDFIIISRKYLEEHRYSPGTWIGTLLHELTHAYVARTYCGKRNYEARWAWANAHNVWFFSVALSVQVQLELVVSEWAWLHKMYGYINLNLQTTLEIHDVLRRHYHPHLERARHRLLQQISEGVSSFLLVIKEENEARRRESEERLSLTLLIDDDDEDYEVYGDVSFYPQLFRE